jgi:hypothetical protein
LRLRGWHDGAVPGNRIGPLGHDLNFDHALLLHLMAHDVLVYGLPVHAPDDCKAALSLPARSPLAKPPVRRLIDEARAWSKAETARSP